MNTSELVKKIENGDLDAMLSDLYGAENIESEKKRYSDAVRNFEALYGAERDVHAYSVAGRTEISGNHTDHNHGRVIAGSLNLDIIAIAAARDDSIIRVKSEGFDEQIINFCEYTTPRKENFGTSGSIIAGMCAGFGKSGYKVGGFDAYMTSNVLKGSGMSSSAAYEDMIGNILNYIYNDGKVDNVEIAKLAQYAENEFFGKACGLMDQMACGVGGIISIDFADVKNPVIEKMNFDISKAGYNLCIVNTGGNHADLGADYDSVPAEMKSVAHFFGKEVLHDVDENDVIKHIPELRENVGDRAILRSLHFFEENKRVDVQKKALDDGDLELFLANVLASGRSSFCYLQNVYTTINVREQGLSLALCLADKYLSGKKAAFRVHGGGFAGTIQAFVPENDAEGFRKYMDSAFGEGACLILRIRKYGAVRVI